MANNENQLYWAWRVWVGWGVEFIAAKVNQLKADLCELFHVTQLPGSGLAEPQVAIQKEK